MVEFVSHHSIARPSKPPVGRNDLRDTAYTSRVVDDFILNFVAMATGVGPVEICLTSLDTPTLKTSARRKDLLDISYTNRLIADFVTNFKFYCDQQGWSQ